ncbi:hypothetical protein OIE66_11750 [Nonomuraea sp. NBC_01738]|uniref:hypothetical protein n=1 Tax=Nonomuraea sp. NBC_01738 TaxID=2976003 RepID=UPI002E0F09E4|nr:hypothetical protein OIE66_11750 [Nonomuraea sp. NBC_01738]
MRRAASWIATGPLAVIVAAMLVTSGSAATGRQEAVAAGGPVTDITYSCKTADGPARKATIRSTVTIRNPEAVGTAARPLRVTMKIVMVRDILGDILPGQDVESLAGKMIMNMNAHFVPQDGGAATDTDLTWRQMDVPAATVPDSGHLRLTSATARAGQPGGTFVSAVPGTVSYFAKSLDFELTTTPEGLGQISCTPTEQMPLIKVLIREKGTGTGFCPPVPTATALNPDLEVPEVPPTATSVKVADTGGCAKVKGFSNIKKLEAGTMIEAISAVRGIPYALQWLIPNDAPPPATLIKRRVDYAVEQTPVVTTGTFLSFGFVPITTTVELTPIGIANAHLVDVARAAGGEDLVAVVNAKIKLRVLKASANGQPLNVGANCTTSKPLLLQLRGGETYNPPYLDNILTGGTLRGLVEIPPFTGCGVGENLSRLLTASVSGKGNEIQIVQGPLCGTLNDQGTSLCPPEVSLNGPGLSKFKALDENKPQPRATGERD